MHPVSFAFKRGHIRASVAHRDFLRPFEITPARFDALYILRWHGGSCYQSEIWQELGLHPSTISRMLKSMEKRGLVVRQRNAGTLMDCREVIVTLTRYGLDTVVKAIKAFLRADDLRDFYNRMHEKGVAHIKQLVADVRNIAGWLYDVAKHPYPAERPDIAAGERYDKTVKEDVDRFEEVRQEHADLARRRAAIPPEDDPLHLDYCWHPKNRAMQQADPSAWLEKIARDVANIPR